MQWRQIADDKASSCNTHLQRHNFVSAAATVMPATTYVLKAQMSDCRVRRRRISSRGQLSSWCCTRAPPCSAPHPAAAQLPAAKAAQLTGGAAASASTGQTTRCPVGAHSSWHRAQEWTEWRPPGGASVNAYVVAIDPAVCSHHGVRHLISRARGGRAAVLASSICLKSYFSADFKSPCFPNCSSAEGRGVLDASPCMQDELHVHARAACLRMCSVTLSSAVAIPCVLFKALPVSC